MMVIYLDVIIFLDCLVNYLFLIFIGKIFDDKIKFFKLFLISLLSSSLIVLCLFCKDTLSIVKILGGVITSVFAFTSPIKNRKIIEISLFYALNFALVGFFTTFKVIEWYLFSIGLIFVFVIFILENFKKYYINILGNEYNVIINISKKEHTLKAFLDTGNMALYQGLPIVFINEKYRNDKIEDDIFFPLKTIAGEEILKGYNEKKLIVKIKHKRIVKNVIISYCKMDYDCILGMNLFI